MRCGPCVMTLLMRLGQDCSVSQMRHWCVGSYSLGKTVSSESSIFRSPPSTYPVLERGLPGQGPWGVSSPAARPGTPFSGPGQERSGQEGGDVPWF